MSNETLDRDDIQATGLEPPTQPKGLALVLKALRSGDYKKTSGALRIGKCFCALGVVADVFLKEHGQTWKEFDRECEKTTVYQVLPPHIASWAFGEGEDGNPAIITGIDKNGAPDFLPMAQLVDSLDLSFEDIADLVENTFS